MRGQRLLSIELHTKRQRKRRIRSRKHDVSIGSRLNRVGNSLHLSSIIIATTLSILASVCARASGMETRTDSDKHLYYLLKKSHTNQKHNNHKHDLNSITAKKSNTYESYPTKYPTNSANYPISGFESKVLNNSQDYWLSFFVFRRDQSIGDSASNLQQTNPLGLKQSSSHSSHQHSTLNPNALHPTEITKSSSGSHVNAREVMSFSHRLLKPPGGDGDDRSSESGGESSDGGGSNYTGCLEMTEDELEEAWQFPGEMPECTGGVSDSSYQGGNSYGSGGGSFDITNCASYSNVWLWDLALSCDDDTTLDGCHCTFAEGLYVNGEIECATSTSGSPPRCPSDCSVCQTCMVLLGCEDIYAAQLSPARTYLPYMIASGIGLGITGLILYFSSVRRQKRKRVGGVENRLPAHLMEIDPPVHAVNPQPRAQKTNNVWLAPVLT